jgi:hypothetical protein
MTEQLGVSLRQLQVLYILWEAGEPILRSRLLSRFHELYEEPIEDVTLRGILMGMDERNLIDRQPAPREPGTMGRSFILYSARPRRADLIPGIIETIFGDALRDDPEALKIALGEIERRLRRTGRRSSST